MASYFKNKDHIEYFAIGFDFVRGHLPESRIEEIIKEIEAFSDTYPDHLETAIALDALYDAIEDRSSAILALRSYIIDNSLLTLREARQRMLDGDEEEVEPLLQFVIDRYLEISSVRQLCAMIAYGRMNDRKAFSETWDALFEQYDISEHVPEENLIDDPMKYVLLPDLPFREQMEAINLMITFEIKKGREAEIMGLVRGFGNYITNLINIISQDQTSAGFRRNLEAIPVIAAISEGCAAAAEEIIKEPGAVSRSGVLAAITDEIEKIRGAEVRMRVLELLVRWLATQKKLASEILPVLREQCEGDDQPIEEMLLLMGHALPSRIAKEIRSSLSRTHAPDSRLHDEKLDVLVSSGKYTEALAYAEVHKILEPDQEEYMTLKLHALTESGRDEEAIAYLLELMKKGNTFANHAMLFELALSFDRIEDLLNLKPVFESLNMRAGVLLLDAYDRMKKGDVKGGLALIEQGKRSGLPDDAALVFSARFLLTSGYPKRVVGICSKMLRDMTMRNYAYPLLITAYRDLGRVKEAEEMEEEYNGLDHP
ncbi:MAG: hypothetical protein NTZ39_08535 [Methanoregula sp.]|nr:hypothetical protein [Methanoregula sp.]